MWLVNTSDAEIRSFHFEQIHSEGYAILSHVWDDKEDTFQELHGLSRLPVKDRWSQMSSKTRNCCTYAASLGFQWVWIDTCCIDKSSSAELSEAINSMYRWYAGAELCIVFLQDVSDSEDPLAPDSTFHRSKWFTRGWTLQELIAPRNVVFVSESWRSLGTKARLASALEDITLIDLAVLQDRSLLFDVSIARRMSWAAYRQTTRVEDEAYSLMGLFQVNMPTIYGEGRNAFRRLQEAILKKSPDHTLFAWSNFAEWASRGSDSIFASSTVQFGPKVGEMRSLPLEKYGAAFYAFSVAASKVECAINGHHDWVVSRLWSYVFVQLNSSTYHSYPNGRCRLLTSLRSR